MAINVTQAPIVIGDYAEPRRGETIIAPGFNPGLKGAKQVLAGFSMAKPKIVTKHKI